MTEETTDREHTARRVAELSAKMTSLAEVLQRAERTVAEVCRGISDRRSG
jgi:hypothetical protein